MKDEIKKKKHYNVRKDNPMFGVDRSGRKAPCYGKKFPEHSKKMKGNKNAYIDGRTKAKYYCIEPKCNNRITYQTWKYGKRKCQKCMGKIYSKEKRGKKHSKKTKEKMRKNLVKHHIYLKENSKETLKLKRSKHGQLHQKVYYYIYYRYGKKGIDDYIKWFDKKFGLK